MPADTSGTADSLTASTLTSSPLADGAAATDVLVQVYEANWIVGPLVDPWRVGPLMPSFVGGPPPP